MSDYLAYFPIGSGSSWGWGDTPHEAVSNCIISLKDWSDYYVVNGKEMKCQVFYLPDAEGFTSDHRGLFAMDADEMYGDEPEEPRFIASFKTPKHRRYSNESAKDSALLATIIPWADKEAL